MKVEHKMYPGTTHEFFGMAAVAAAKDAQARAGKNLKQAFRGHDYGTGAMGNRR